jgi:hypothetical protein
MARLLLRALKSATLFAYGLFILFVYGLLQIKNGNFFKRSTEKENLELQLGTYNHRLWEPRVYGDREVTN